MDLHNIDLNLLVILDELSRRRKVSAVAEALDMTQPAVSNALNRLRKILGDDLFVRGGKGMTPTPFAERLREPIENALRNVHFALNQARGFDPKKSERRFTVAMTTIGEIIYLPKLVDRLNREAPFVSISTVRHNPNLREGMEEGSIDLAIGNLPGLTRGFMRRKIDNVNYVVLLRTEHPILRRPIGTETLKNMQFVEVVSSETGHIPLADIIGEGAALRNVRLKIPHFSSLAHILKATDLVTIVPEAYAREVTRQFGLLAVPSPLRLPPLAINVMWHMRSTDDSGNRWFRELVFHSLQGGQSGQPNVPS